MKLGATIYVDSIEKSYEAVELYKEAFGLTLGFNSSYEDTTWMEQYGITVRDDYIPKKGYFHAELMRNGETILIVSAEGDDSSCIPHGHQFVVLGMQMGCEEAVKKAVSVLSAGTITPKDEGWNPLTAGVTDPFNVSWCIYM